MKLIINLVTALVLLSTSESVWAWKIENGDLQVWLAQLKPKNSVYSEMNKYFISRGGLNPADQQYTKDFTARSNQILVKLLLAANQKFSSSLSCQASSLVDFPGAIVNATAGSAFEKDLIRIQSVDCLGVVDIDKVFGTMMSDSFQKQGIPAIKRVVSNQQTNQVCHDTYVFLLGSSSYCFTQNIWKNNDTYVIQSYNEANNGAVDIPVYFREVYTLIKKLKNGQVVMVNLSYGRGPDLPLQQAAVVYVSNQHSSLISLLKSKVTN